MAEGVEETENNNNAETPAMLGTVLPCEAMTASLGGIKRDFDPISVVQQLSPPPAPSHTTSLTTTAAATTAASSAITSSGASTSSSSSSSSASSTRAATKSPSPSLSSTSSQNLQQHPINLKSEDNEKDFCHRIQTKSPSTITNIIDCEKDKCSPSEFYKNLNNGNGGGGGGRSSSPHEQSKSTAAAVAAAAAAQAHLNGTMQDMINLQKLQNLASIQQQQQQQQQQHSGVLAGLQGLAGISSAAAVAAAAALNSPLNLSVGSTSSLSSNSPKHQPTVGALGGSGTGLVGCSPTGGTSQMPQLILASGQLVQGVQGAQLLIPTSQGIAVQTILTIPVSQQINTNEQFLQNYAALNSGANPFNSSPLVPQTQIPSSLQQQSNFLKPNLFSHGVQQLLAALHPQLFSAAHLQTEPLCSPIHPQQQQQQQQSQSKSHLLSQQTLGSGYHHHHHPQHHHHQSSDSISPKLESHRHESSPSGSSSIAQHLRASPLSNLNSVIPQPKQSPSSRNSTNYGINLSQEKLSSSSSLAAARASSPPTTTATASSSAITAGGYSSSSGSQLFHSHSPNSSNHITASNSSHSLSSQINSPSSACVLNSINRLTSSNGELTITKSHGPSSSSAASATAAALQSSSSSVNVGNHHSTSSPSPGPPSSHHQQSQSMKLSPSSMQISPTGTEASTTDLLVDSPNEPTINQTNCNVVDGIDLDEIKEFAKAFKLRRLSLGLTQTQVGQALSVTEGPAYSQSAICSALAAQMYAAQLSSQQQNMFEKLDITPKSAQKIKPVLERWMKEAEESHWNRYKSGQNHLTDFIGVEPSKKRKRRTSFTPQALELLNAHFERNTHPSGTEITGLAHQLGYEREVIRIWFCNKRQALKNTVRMMSKGMV